jgi:hypothetical protein
MVGPEKKTTNKEGPMTTAGQAFLFVGELLCLSFAAIAMFYFAERLRSDFLSRHRTLQRKRLSSSGMSRPMTRKSAGS